MIENLKTDTLYTLLGNVSEILQKCEHSKANKESFIFWLELLDRIKNEIDLRIVRGDE